jgi:hypothetical protein
MAEAPINRGAPEEPRAHTVPKPSPVEKAAAKPETPVLENRQVNNAASFDSTTASGQVVAGAAQQSAAGGATLHGAANAAAAPPLAQPSQTGKAAKAAPSVTLRAYGASAVRTPDGSAQISGTIADSSGAAIPHAKVTLDQTLGTAHRETFTDATGRFTIGSLQPGKDRLEISSPGFIVQAREVDLGTSQLARVDSQLSAGAASETVEVQAASPALKTESSSVQSLWPDKKAPQTSVSSGARTLVLDTSGKLFLNKRTGKRWKAVHGPWKKSTVTDLSLTTDQQFRATTAQGSWLSTDGEHWHPAN